MSDATDARELFDAIGDVVEENVSDDGVDIVSVFVSLIEALRQDPNMDIEKWELLQLSLRNCIDIMNNLIDEEIAKLRAEKDSPSS